MPDSIPEQPKHRLAFIDWARGLACIGMFEVHAYDSWLGGSARQGPFYGWSRFSGTLPAPLFVFLAGLSCALLSDRMRRKNATVREVALRLIRRGAEILALALLFRSQEFLLSFPVAPRSDLLRVDVLNMMGVSIMLIGVLCWIVQERTARTIAAACVALGISMAAPLVWTSWRPTWLPWYLESYIDGVHIYGTPQAWLFPIFPWTAFAFAGLAVGYLLFGGSAAGNPSRTMTILGAGGLGACLAAWGLDAMPLRLYAVQDYWHTSPEFLLMRVGLVMMTIWIAYAWCHWGWGTKGFSPLIVLGQSSLLVYWVHSELVYGRFSILQKHQQGILSATLGLILLSAMMVALATAKVRWRERVTELLVRLRQAPSAATGS